MLEESLNRLIDGLCRVLDAVIAGMLAVMVVLVFGNVVLRYGFNSGITTSDEISRWLYVWMTFLGAIVALKEHAHLGSDFLVSRLKPAGRRLCLVVGQVLMLYTTWLIFSGSLTQSKINWDVHAPVTGMSVALFYGSGIVFAVAAFVLLARDLIRSLGGRTADEDLVMVQESEDIAQVEALQLDRGKTWTH